MRDIEKLCVTSNMGQIDSSLINYSKMLSFSFSNTINIINFLHFQPHYNLPTSILHNFPVLQKNSLVEETKEMVKGIYGYKYKNVFFSFLNDNTIQSLLNFEKSFSPDLYLFGMKKNESIFDLYILSFIQKIGV